MGEKPEAEREGGRKMSTEDSHIWPVLFLGFSPNKYGGKKCSVPKDELNKYWHTDMVCILAPSHFSNTNTQSFNLSTICDQLNNMWFIFKCCKHANCWVCAPARVCTSNHLHCQVKSISMDHRFFSSGTSFLYSVVTRAIKPLKQQSEVAPSACMIFPLHFRKCQ